MTCKPVTIASKYSDSLIKTGVKPNLNMFDILNEQTNPADAYDIGTLINTSRNLATALNRSDTSKYPLLDSRYRQSPILFSEIADFITDSGLNIDQVDKTLSDYNDVIQNLPTPAGSNPPVVSEANIPSDVKNVFSQLEFYYSDNMANSISGGFCAAIANPFGKLLAAIEALKFSGDLLGKLLDFDLGSLLSPLTALKASLGKIVDSLKETIMSQVDGIVKSATALINNVKQGAKKIMAKLKKMVNNIKAFFSDDSTATLKDKIGEFVQKSMDQFKEITPEAIALMLFRFCQFTETMQAFMMSPVEGLKKFVTNVALQESLIEKISTYRTQDAVNAGAVRIDDAGIKESKERIIAAANSAALSHDKTTPPTATPNSQEYVPTDRVIRTQPPERSRRGTGATDVGPRPEPEQYVASGELTEAENEALANLGNDGVDGYFKFSGSVLNMGSNVNDAVPGDGYRMVKNEVWYKLMAVARRMGKTLTINSAYRSPAYNAKVGGATSSFHKSGMALDVSMAGFSDDDIRQFIRIASQEGFGGVAYYSGSNFTHVDIGSRRSWNRGHRFDSYIAMHVEDGFRKGHGGNQVA
jgi:hypothetical protein